jgi:hypothetical protein
MKPKERQKWETMLTGTDYQLAARALVHQFSSGVVKKELASLFYAFLERPCLETAVPIIEFQPEFVAFFREARAGGILQNQESVRAANNEAPATTASPMGGSIEQYVTTVVDATMENAVRLATVFERMCRERNLLAGVRDLRETLVRFFAFLNWAIANGVWSTLDIPVIRQSLMAMTLWETALRLASHGGESPGASSCTHEAGRIRAELGTLAREQVAFARKLEKQAHKADANGVMLFVLECLQRQYRISDTSMDSLVGGFLSAVGDYASIERLAIEVNWAVRNSHG